MEDLDTPKCPVYLLQTEAVERRKVVVWLCPGCGLVRF
jgi:ribosomal protein L37AE/L43A